ncbi:TolC family outer membrane protein [Aquitalea denitrificans]|uniref:TolC family outer membrane protein n=1 Tax=Aquitalea denitrificans TaxID=519081 RepID=UPI0013575E2D|nr:TolC family outer membrane protein [Aquitalea denitrificans]
MSKRALFRPTLLAAACLLVMPMLSAGHGLLEGLQLARANDAQYQAAMAEREAGEANGPLGRAQLLPTLNASFNRSKVTGSDTAPDYTGAISTSPLNYMSQDAAIQLRQPLFNLQRWALYQQGQARVDYSQALFARKDNELVLRYLSAYLGVLLSQQNLALSEAKLHALSAARTQAQKLFEQGDGTVTDIHDAEARMAMADAELIEARNMQLIAERTLQTTTGQPATALAEPEADIGRYLGTVGQLAEWRDKALALSPDIRAAQQNVRIAEQEVKRARAGNYPTLELVASKDRSSASSVSTINQRITQNVIGVELSVPLFNGGYNSAQLAQSAAQYRQAQAELDNARAQVELEVSRQYYGVSTGARKVASLQKAVFSSAETVKASKLGLVAGVKTLTDILNSEEQLYQARRDLLLAQYNQLVSWIALRADCGVLGQQDLILLDRHFSVVSSGH